ncbi:hypothetical protein ACSDR0_46785 [Streptosporangium sp. G11]|uniref:hypothetical protein n=1 Tax=Streptosporangium sp. G11 TaxID=3436926 RepID=UPI003EB8D2A1
MGPVVVGVIGTLLGVLIGGVLQQVQASRMRKWQRADSLSNAKQSVYAEFLRAISASYAQALSGQRSRSEDANLLAATAEIEILSSREVSKPARDLVDMVMRVHAEIADDVGVATTVVEDVDRQRHKIIELFKADLGIEAHP